MKNHAQAQTLERALEDDDHGCVHADTISSALEIIDEMPVILVVLETSLPEHNGFDGYRHLRQNFSKPIILISASDNHIDRVVGLELGAADFLTMPFHPAELAARAQRALAEDELRTHANTRQITSDGLSIDHRGRVVMAGEEEVSLTPKEFELFWYLASNEGEVISRQRILREVWNYHTYVDTRTVDVHIRQIRRKLKKHSPIVTVWGVGYKAILNPAERENNRDARNNGGAQNNRDARNNGGAQNNPQPRATRRAKDRSQDEATPEARS